MQDLTYLLSMLRAFADSATGRSDGQASVFMHCVSAEHCTACRCSHPAVSVRSLLTCPLFRGAGSVRVRGRRGPLPPGALFQGGLFRRCVRHGATGV